MRTKQFALYISLILSLTFCFGFVSDVAKAAEYTVGEVSDLIDGIVSYKLNAAGAADIQDWVDGGLTDGAGTSAEWYAITVSQMGGYDMSSYRRSLERYVQNEKKPSSATTREKLALALIASGSSDRFITDTIDDSIDELGLMSWIYGLHLLNNGFNGHNYGIHSVTEHLLSSQFTDGGWAIMGEHGDIDVTAMTINALAPYYHDNGDVAYAVDRGLDFLSYKQLDNGGYSSFGTENPESTAQVLMAVSALGIDCQHDSRFIKNGNTLIDGIASFRLEDGSFSHIPDGPSNDSATMQSFYSLVSYKRMLDGGGPMFIMDRAAPDETVTVNNEQSDTKDEINNEATAGYSVTTADNSNTAESRTERSTSVVTVKSVASSAVTTLTVTSARTNFTTVSSTVSSAVSASITSKASSEIIKGDNSGGYKPVAIAVIWGLAVVSAAILFAAGKRNKKNYIAVIIAASIGSGIVLFTDIQTREQYYSGSSEVKENPSGTVTLSIRCDTIVGKGESEYIPDDGIILDTTDFAIEDGETVFDVLTEAARTYGIQVENSGGAGNAHGNVYISGINYLYEFQYGDLSGWIYHVNGVSPSVNCGEYVLSDGDSIEWLYTCELGYDLEEK